MKRLSQYFQEYAGYHRTAGNKLCHYIGIPMITIAVLGGFSHLIWSGGEVSVLRLDAGIALWLGASLWYCVMDWRLGGPFAFASLGLYFVGRAFEPPFLWGLFVVGWIFQLIGHGVYEKKSPAFTKNVEHLLIGPLWVFARSIGYRSK